MLGKRKKSITRPSAQWVDRAHAALHAAYRPAAIAAASDKLPTISE
jgi:hypothetical protein